MTWLYIWLGVTAFALILEFITTDLVSIWFAGGGLVAMLLAGLGVELYIHLPVFIVVSFAMMLCFRKMVMRRFNVGGTVSNTEAVIGKEVKLITGILIILCLVVSGYGDKFINKIRNLKTETLKKGKGVNP